MAIFVDLHAIQTVGPNNLNRGLDGSPKTALFGGARRARVSSQALKRAMRTDFNEKYSPENLGIRTKRIVKLLKDDIVRQSPDLEPEATELAIAAFTAAGIKLEKPKVGKDQEIKDEDWVANYLIFLSTAQIEAAAEVAIKAYEEGGLEQLKTAAVKKALKAALNSDLSVDLALFGRMVADDATLNVDASCQVAHALSTHPVETEFDFFTAVDDEKQRADEEDAGAGMMGNVEFGSSTLYRYATINATALTRQLGSTEAAVKAIEGFVDVFATSLPTGKQNTFAAHSFPSALVVSVRNDRPASWVGAFERPVYPRKNADTPVEGYTTESARRMFAHGAALDAAYGGPIENDVVLLTQDLNGVDVVLSDPDVVSSLQEIQEQVGAAVQRHLEEA